ncbi:MAG: DUF2304 domain-containing protein [Nitrospirota bacterium]
MDIVKVLAVTGSASVLFVVFELIRRGRLKERYALLWLFSGLVILALSLFRSVVEYIAHIVGIAYPPSLLFLVAFGFLMLITLHFSVIISGLSEKNKRLAQDIALLRQALEEVRRSTAGRGANTADRA